MWFETLVREETGCATYMIGCQQTGDCAVFDPLWDIQPYLDKAKEKNSKIRYVIDSHSHADHVSGATWLAEVTGAELILPELADITYKATRVKHGDMIRMGGVGMEVVHVPGHRPEQINLLVYDFPRGDEPWFMLTADFVLVGDVARPDLAQSNEEGAPVLFDVSIPRFLNLPDHVEVYPGHLAGSTWGRVTSGKVATTVGYERRFNDSLKFKNKDQFIRYMEDDQPLKPANIINIVAINQGKQPSTRHYPKAYPLTASQVKSMMAEGAVVVDGRSSAIYGAKHIPGSINVQIASGEFEQRIGWMTPNNAPLILLMDRDEEAQEAIYKMAFIGLDTRVVGYLPGGIDAWQEAGHEVETVPQMNVHDLHHKLTVNGLQVLDVRDSEECDEGHIENTHFLPYTRMVEQITSPAMLDTLNLDKDQHIAVTCATGKRSSTAISVMKRDGYKNLYNVTGGMEAWKAAGFPMIDGEGNVCNI